MINFTDTRVYVKGTCNVICTDVTNGNIVYQSNKMSTGNITPSTSLNEIRAGLGNPIAAMIPSDSQLQVDFSAADFSMWAKAAQLGASLSFSAPVADCRTVTASSATLTIGTANGTPVAPLGLSKPVCYVQRVNEASSIYTDGIAYEIEPATGNIKDFVAENGVQYKVWYYKQKETAQIAKISSFIDPKVVRFEAQIAVYANKSGGEQEGTRIGWLYYTIPYLKLQGDATITGDQNNNDETKISGQAIAYDSEVVSATCSDCDSSTLGYLVYAPDDAASVIQGLAVTGGVVALAKNTTAQMPVRFVMADGSLVKPSNYTQGFSYQATGITIDADGTIHAGTTAQDYDCTITYTNGSSTLSCVVTVHVTA